MKISTILDYIDNGHIALPEFQRGYVWNREQVRGLFDSLYRKHPVGGLLVWTTESKGTTHRGNASLATGVVKLLLDGQQRVTTIYGVVRGRAPKFFDGNSQAFTGLYFHLEKEIFEFYQPIKMKDDVLWIDVTELMQKGVTGLSDFFKEHSDNPDFGKYMDRLSRLLNITEIDLYVEEVSGADKSIEVVVDIFNRVNSGGTKLSKGDLALAKICSEWPEARDIMKAELKKWEQAGLNFTLDWLLRSVNTILTGEAKFQYLHEKNSTEVQDGVKHATDHINTCLNYIGGRLGLDHDQVFFGRFAVPVMVRYLDQRKSYGLPSSLDNKERDKLLFWYLQAAMWGRFSGSTESVIDKDLEALEGPEGGLDKLLEQLRLWHGSLSVQPDHFTGWSLGARFYPVLYLLTRMGEAQDWGTGLPLKASLLGKMNRLEVHHIFPKAQLYKHGYKRTQVNALANFCFLTKDTNINISDTLPEIYFPKIEEAHPGALASQWIPQDPKLWSISRFPDFLEARKELLAAELNLQMEKLLHDETHWLQGTITKKPQSVETISETFNDMEEAQLTELNNWIANLDLLQGEMNYDFADAKTGEQKAIFDMCWPNGIQEELSEPVALILDQSSEVISLASEAGYRCFNSIAAFQKYIERNILAQQMTVE